MNQFVEFVCYKYFEDIVDSINKLIEKHEKEYRIKDIKYFISESDHNNPVAFILFEKHDL